MKYTLTVGDVIDVPVRGSVKDGARTVDFNFTLQMKRLSSKDAREALDPDAGIAMRDVLTANVIGWRGQRLVQDEAGEPATFDAEALDCLLTLAGMEFVCFTAYLKAIQTGETAAGRRGN